MKKLRKALLIGTLGLAGLVAGAVGFANRGQIADNLDFLASKVKHNTPIISPRKPTDLAILAIYDKKGDVVISSTFDNPEVDKKIEYYRIVDEDEKVIYDSRWRQKVHNQEEIHDFISMNDLGGEIIKGKKYFLVTRFKHGYILGNKDAEKSAERRQITRQWMD